MKVNNDNAIDKLFSEKLASFEQTPSPEVWENIAQKLNRKKRRERLFVWIASGVAAAFLLFVGILGLLTNDVEDAVIQKIVVAGTEDEKATTTNFVVKDATEKVIESEKKKTLFENPKIKVENKEKKYKETIITERKRKLQPIIAETKPCILNYTEKAAALMKKFPKEATNQYTLDTSSQPDFASLEKEYVKNHRQKWSVVGQLQTAYTNEKSKGTGASGMVNVGGGVQVNYALNDRLSVQTGIAYSRYSQEYASQKTEVLLENVSAKEMGNPMNLYEKGVAVPEQLAAGKLKLKNTMSAASYASATTLPTSMEQVFDCIEMPFLLRYSLLKQKVGVFVIGGIGINYLFSNGVYKTEKGKQKIGEITNLRTTNYISQFGVGLEYQLSSKMKLNIEPTFKYHLNSLNHDAQFDYKPYSIGVQTGIRIDF